MTSPKRSTQSDSAVFVTAENAGLLAGGLDEWMPDAQAGVPMMAVVKAGQAVALCASVQVANGVHCAGVETVLHLRGRGFGGQAVNRPSTFAGRNQCTDAESGDRRSCAGGRSRRQKRADSS